MSHVFPAPHELASSGLHPCAGNAHATGTFAGAGGNDASPSPPSRHCGASASAPASATGAVAGALLQLANSAAPTPTTARTSAARMTSSPPLISHQAMA